VRAKRSSSIAAAACRNYSPELIELGLDIFNPFQPEVMDPYEIKQKYGRKLSFLGGMSVQKLLPFGTPRAVRDETLRLLEQVGRGGGFIIAPSHDMTGDIPVKTWLPLSTPSLTENYDMARPITLCAGQWADLPLEVLADKAKGFGFDGLELCCNGDHFEVARAMSDSGYCDRQKQTLAKRGLKMFSLSNHLVGQAILDPIDQRHKSILPTHVWGDGDPAGVCARAAEELKNTARAAKKLGLHVVNGFHRLERLAPALFVPAGSPDDDRRRLQAAGQAVPSDPRRVRRVRRKIRVGGPSDGNRFDIYTAERAIEALDRRPEFGFNFDPSHLIWQGVDPAKFIRKFPDRIYHVHMKDALVTLDGWSGILSSHLNFGDSRRGWDFRSLGRGGVNFEAIIRALNDIGYTGPLSVEWEDSGMERERGAREACEFVRRLDFEPSRVAFDAAFDKAAQAK